MNKDYIKTLAFNMLTEKRKKHTLGVMETAAALSDRFGGDKDKAEIASICHDIFRGIKVDELNSLVKKYSLDDKYLNNPNLAHGKLAKEYMEKEWGIDDRDILNAVSFHTTGRWGMSLLEKIVFLADAIEPGRDYPEVESIRSAALNDLDKACLMSLEGTVKHLIDSGIERNEIDKDTLEAIDYFFNKEK